MRRAVDLPVDRLAQAGLLVDPVDPQDRRELVGLGHVGEGGLLGHEHEDHDAENGGAQGGLDDVGGQGQSDHGADDGAGRGDEGHGHGQAEAGQVHPQEPGPGGQSAAEGHQKTGAPDEVQVEGEEPADDGDEEDAAPHPSEDGQDPHDERHDEENQRPNPPGSSASGLQARHGFLGPQQDLRGEQCE